MDSPTPDIIKIFLYIVNDFLYYNNTGNYVTIKRNFFLTSGACKLIRVIFLLESFKKEVRNLNFMLYKMILMRLLIHWCLGLMQSNFHFSNMDVYVQVVLRINSESICDWTNWELFCLLKEKCCKSDL